MSDDLTVHILTEIRDELRGVRDEVRSVRDEVRVTNQLLDETRTELKAEIAQVRDEVGHKILAVELRVATGITNLNATSIETNRLLTDRFELRDRVERCEHEIDELKKKVG